MSDKSQVQNNQISSKRMRIGVSLIFFWWLPLGLITFAIAEALGWDSALILLITMIVQTAIGLIGMWITGKQVANIIRKTPNKKVPGRVWHVLAQGSL